MNICLTYGTVPDFIQDWVEDMKEVVTPVPVNAPEPIDEDGMVRLLLSRRFR